MNEPHAYRRENLGVRAMRDDGSTDWQPCDDAEADCFEVYTKDNSRPVDFFDSRKEAEEYLELIAQ